MLEIIAQKYKEQVDLIKNYEVKMTNLNYEIEKKLKEDVLQSEIYLKADITSTLTNLDCDNLSCELIVKFHSIHFDDISYKIKCEGRNLELALAGGLDLTTDKYKDWSVTFSLDDEIYTLISAVWESLVDIISNIKSLKKQ